MTVSTKGKIIAGIIGLIGGALLVMAVILPVMRRSTRRRIPQDQSEMQRAYSLNAPDSQTAHPQTAAPLRQSPPPRPTPATQNCLSCHTTRTSEIVSGWKTSRHAAAGVGCAECHAADRADPGAFRHNGVMISERPAPSACARCHEPGSVSTSIRIHPRSAHRRAVSKNPPDVKGPPK